MGNYKLADGYTMNTLHPSTFHIPSEEEINSLKVGSLVRIKTESINDEVWEEHIPIPEEQLQAAKRTAAEIISTPAGYVAIMKATAEGFWVEIQQINRDKFVGKVINTLVFKSYHHLDWGDKISFEKKNILTVQ